jgi:hypothetical protein
MSFASEKSSPRRRSNDAKGVVVYNAAACDHRSGVARADRPRDLLRIPEPADRVNHKLVRNVLSLIYATLVDVACATRPP